MSLQFHQIQKFFNGKQVLDITELRLPNKKVTAILGPSGCGKTTLLRIAAGLEKADQGTIVWQESVGDEFDSDGKSPVERIDSLTPAVRGISFAMQQPVITPHWTVEQHWRFPLEQIQNKENLTTAEISERITQCATVLELTTRLKQLARELSGGEQQRVALGRAMIRRSRCLLLDEPLSQLDRPLRIKLQKAIRDEIMRLGTSAIWVTHDVTEALAVADYLVVMIAGRVVQCGTPSEVQKQPVNAHVRELVS